MLRLIGWSLILIGVIITFVSLLSLPSSSGFGGVILIGPIPIVFGSTPYMALAAMILAIAIMLISIALWRR
ncbi:MAG: DUF131 domain-containing protein [Methanothrix sp.]|jgi:uncharacterized protein (TIGR00304 family)|uniref:DUF131 domain-containing protein n=1 Tax=Methanothrix thermoacetophila (strain DSM 6194 / JCM 14653 / NBRC 101360 / PT) TaxID=349307 RepID=A0B7P6_METTP|nr:MULTISPECIES: DUF131 domain-containing protein [Methanothrix]ABK14720.1 Protein of unknown function DUF131 [Methanothrix thermoacetophila PT]MBC7079008.1 DUF131 domain-containing protein [Methanothrix sp.]NPU87164.1 DUF131 domain-containing protein [Methanothrix sp.]